MEPLNRHNAEFAGRRQKLTFLAHGLALVGTLIAVALIFSSYRFSNQTADEPDHVGAGLQWIRQGTFTLDPIDPPLPRVFVAIGPALMKAYPTGQLNVWREGDRVLHEGDTRRLLTAARVGTLPWFLLLMFLVWRRSCLLLGDWGGTAAVWLLAFCPPILANSALATTDICFTATYYLAIEALWAVFVRPSLRNFALAGASAGLTVLSKFSAFPYLGLSTAAAIFLFYRMHRRFPAWRMLATYTAVGFLVIGTGYRWMVGPLASHYATSQAKVDRLVNKAGPFRSAARYAVDHVPLAPFWQGILALAKFGHTNRTIYFLGRNISKGSFAFYLVVFLEKTPLPLLVLGLAGLTLTFWPRRGSVFRLHRYTPLALSAMLLPPLFATLTRVDLGLRHILVVYPFWVLFAALGAKSFWEKQGNQKIYARFVVFGCFIWQVTSTFRTSPDFLVYANEVSKPYARSISIDADYDWGQDLNRLIADLDRRHVDKLWITYSGFAECDMNRLPRWHTLPDGQQVNGWVAISEQAIRRHPDDYGWLNQYKPVEEVGHTIRLYYLDPRTVPTSLSWDQRVEPKKPEDAF